MEADCSIFRQLQVKANELSMIFRPHQAFTVKHMKSYVIGECHGGPIVISGDSLNSDSAVEKLLTEDNRGGKDEVKGTFWLAPSGSTAEFVLELCPPRKVRTLTVVNTHAAEMRNRGTKEFKVYLGEDTEDWTEVAHETFEDPRESTKTTEDEVNINWLTTKNIDVTDDMEARYVRFELISFYGEGGGLQFFYANKGEYEYKFLRILRRQTTKSTWLVMYLLT